MFGRMWLPFTLTTSFVVACNVQWLSMQPTHYWAMLVSHPAWYSYRECIVPRCSGIVLFLSLWRLRIVPRFVALICARFLLEIIKQETHSDKYTTKCLVYIVAICNKTLRLTLFYMQRVCLLQMIDFLSPIACWLVHLIMTLFFSSRICWSLEISEENFPWAYQKDLRGCLVKLAPFLL